MKGRKSKIPVPSAARKMKINAMKSQYSEEVNDLFQNDIDEIQNDWKAEKAKFLKLKNEYDDSLDKLLQETLAKQEELTYQLATINKENQELTNRLEQLRKEKQQIIMQVDQRVIEKKAEVDLELNLQQKSVELSEKFNQFQRNLDQETHEMKTYKKNYKRALDEYKEMRQLVEAAQLKKEVKLRKAELLRKQQELDKKKAEEAQRKKDPMNKYKALLAAAGHTNDAPERPPRRVFTIDDEMFDKNDGSDDGFIIHEYPDYEQEQHIQNRIDQLLATGNYTEDDPVIRSLRKELATVKH